MHRTYLLNLLSEYQSEVIKSGQAEGLTPLAKERCADQLKQATRMTHFISDYENCFERSCSCGHITGSAWLVDPTQRKVLLTHHAKLNAWFQLGGHSDGEAHTLEVACAEAREESGLSDITILKNAIFDIDIHRIPARKTEREHYHYDVRFALQAVGSTSFVVSDESHDLAWVAIDKIGQYSNEESLMRMAQKWSSR